MPAKKKKPQEHPANLIEIDMGILKCHIVVTWERDLDKTAAWLRDRGCVLSKDWIAHVRGNMGAIGLCTPIGEGGQDMLVWLRKRPRKCSEYGTLYHELHHAIWKIAANRAFLDETEFQAYAFEHAVNECNRRLW